VIGPGTGVRVYLAFGVTDKRNYVERKIMLSAWRSNTFFLVKS
jgi:hypothetical protein